jgi:ABC-type uncharacterized transport system permease subunit
MSPFDAAWLAAAVRLSAPISFAALGELVAELGGVLNIGLEGMMLVGAFFSFWAALATGSLWIGVLAGIGAGIAWAALMALVALSLRGDQIIVGVGLNILALGTTTVLFRTIPPEDTIRLHPMAAVKIPGLAEIPFFGRALFNQIPIVYLLYVLIPAIWVLVYRTHWGLRARAAGETPRTAESVGASVIRLRWTGTLLAGAGAGLAGAFLSVGQTGSFAQGMSGGRGFLALAAVVFGRWRPVPVMGACFLFGAAEALELRMQSQFIARSVWVVLGGAAIVAIAWGARRRNARRPQRAFVILALTGAAAALFAISPNWQLPSELWLSLPYVLSLVVLAGFVGRARTPSALAVPYDRTEH